MLHALYTLSLPRVYYGSCILKQVGVEVEGGGRSLANTSVGALHERTVQRGCLPGWRYPQ